MKHGFDGPYGYMKQGVGSPFDYLREGRQAENDWHSHIG